MRVRFTLTDSIVSPAGTSVPQPVGWKDCAVVLERHADYHSLVEYFEGDFIFFGAGLKLLQQVETLRGPDARPQILIELESSLNYWEQIFDGLIDLSLMEEFSYGRKMYKMKVPIIRNDFWTKFINRKSIPINLSSTVDVDGGNRTAVTPFSQSMPSQKMITKFRSEMKSVLGSNAGDVISFEFDRSGSNEIRVGVFELPIVVSDDIEDRYAYTNGAQDVSALEFMAAKFDGSYAIDVQVVLSTSPYISPFGLGNKTPTTAIFFKKNNDTPVAFTKTDLGTNGVSGRSRYNYQTTLDLKKGDKLTMYAYYSGAIAESVFTVFNGVFEDTYISVTASTVFETTSHEAFKIKDAAESILSKIVGDDEVLVSTALDGCYGKYSLQKGLNVRGYSLSDKPLAMSFDDWWAGANPIFNLGLKYTSDGKIRIEPKSYFYNLTTSINLSNVANIIRTYDTDKFYKTIQVGYEKGLSESSSGIDDPQTKATWSTRFASLGKDEKILSRFMAASLALEQTRRNRVEEGKDWRLDEEIFITALDSDDEVELGSSFDLITGLTNPDSRLNVRLSCGRLFERWRKWFNGCMQLTPEKVYYYANGEGNRNMFSEVGPTDCDYGENPGITENQNFTATNDFVFIPKVYAFKHSFNWGLYKTIRNNPENAIGLSRGTDSHTPHFINKLKFYIQKGNAEFEVAQGTVPTEENGFRLLEDGNYRLLEDGNYRLLN